MSYFRLAHRVPERADLEPRWVTRLYALMSGTCVMRSAYRRFVRGVLRQGVAQGRALDVGTGPGVVAAEVARRCPELLVTALDRSGHMVEQAPERARWAGVEGRTRWLQADGYRLPFADGTFDLVFSSFALHHWETPEQVLDEMARVLRPGGRYYVVDLYREPNLVQRLFAYASVPVISLLFGSYRGYGGYYESLRAGYTVAEAECLMAASTLPPGRVGIDSTWFFPLLTIASRETV
ncbi:MAG: class I SAM-dependent methyltransferase [Anaerolineae bacterium]|nr:class I SAM-dependent methyltransferase [Anaerolineae bacterium]